MRGDSGWGRRILDEELCIRGWAACRNQIEQLQCECACNHDANHDERASPYALPWLQWWHLSLQSSIRVRSAGGITAPRP